MFENRCRQRVLVPVVTNDVGHLCRELGGDAATMDPHKFFGHRGEDAAQAKKVSVHSLKKGGGGGLGCRRGHVCAMWVSEEEDES